MKTRFLLPHYLKRIGWILTIASILINFILNDSNIKTALYQFLYEDKESFFTVINFLDNYIDELVSILLIIGLNLVAFSKEKIEDEWVANIRLQSLQWGVYINSVVLILSLILFYNFIFIQIMVYNMFTILTFFVLRFNYILYIKPLANSLLHIRNNVNTF